MRPVAAARSVEPGAIPAAVADLPRQRPRVLVIAPSVDLTFVADDVALLSRSCQVDVVERRSHPSRAGLLRAVARRLRAARHSLVLVWFAEPYDTVYVLLLARLLGVATCLVVGGYEVASIPALSYGGLATRRNRWQVLAALRVATVVLPTSGFLASEVALLGRTRGVHPIYLGVETDVFHPGAGVRDRLVVTVGTVAHDTYRLKGLDAFARCSRLLPDVQFTILGPCPDASVATELRALGGSNLVLGERRLSREELLPWYQRATVYAQLSVRESFGLAVAEAMSCGCVPVVSAAGSLPEVVGEAGIVVDPADAEAAARGIRRALESGLGSVARARVVGRFPLERRQRELWATLEPLMSARG